MKESDFISQNSGQWKKIEGRLSGKKRSTKGLSKDFVKVVDDLSYAQTFYKRRFVKVYLNGLGVQLYKGIFSKHKKRTGQFKSFWTEELPLLIYSARKEMGLALAIFILAMIVGVVSTHMEPRFATSILGEGYVTMTEENIAKGDPMEVYKDSDALEMFFMIFANNLRVAVFTFALGALAGLGTAGILLSNGVMVGTFQYFFAKKGLFWISFLTIWQHGSIEIPSIVFAGGAGFVLARSMLFPDTFTRGLSIRLGFRKAMRLMMGISPAILLAAIIESFYTRFDDLPIPLRATTVVLGFAVFGLYYVYLPWKVYKSKGEGQLEKESEEYQQFFAEKSIPDGPLQNPSNIIFYTIQFFETKAMRHILFALGSAILSAAAILIFSPDFDRVFLLSSYFTGNLFQDFTGSIALSFERFEDLAQLFDFTRYPVHFFVFTPLIAWVIFDSLKRFSEQYPYFKGERKLKYATTLFPIGLILAVGFLWPNHFYLTLFFIPSLMMGLWFQFSVKNGFSKMFSVWVMRAGMVIGGMIISTLFVFVFFMLIESPLLYIVLNLANDFIGFQGTGSRYILNGFLLTTLLTLLYLSLSFWSYYFAQIAESAREIMEANDLNHKIENLKAKNS
ncbi:MAG: hypothetical protein SchgKO_22540 [Schleiferiaceae bacterium]